MTAFLLRGTNGKQRHQVEERLTQEPALKLNISGAWRRGIGGSFEESNRRMRSEGKQQDCLRCLLTVWILFPPFYGAMKTVSKFSVRLVLSTIFK